MRSGHGKMGLYKPRGGWIRRSSHHVCFSLLLSVRSQNPPFTAGRGCRKRAAASGHHRAARSAGRVLRAGESCISHLVSSLVQLDARWPGLFACSFVCDICRVPILISPLASLLTCGGFETPGGAVECIDTLLAVTIDYRVAIPSSREGTPLFLLGGPTRVWTLLATLH